LQHVVNFPRIGSVNFILQRAHALHQLVLVGLRVAELLSDRVVFIEHVEDLFLAFAHQLYHRLVGVELRLLLQHTHGVVAAEFDLALVVVVNARDQAHERGFSGAVGPDDADLGAIEKGEVNIFEYYSVGRHCLADAQHGEDDVFVGHSGFEIGVQR